MSSLPPLAEAAHPQVVLVHPPAVSKRYLPTRFLPYGMAVLYAFLKEHGVVVSQTDLLLEYLFEAPGEIDVHNPERGFSTEDFLAALHGFGAHSGLRDFMEKYGGRLASPAGMVAFSIVGYPQFWASLLLAAHLRRVNSRLVIVFGGPYITIKPPEAFTRFGLADYWVKGSGELPLLLLYRRYQGKISIRSEEIPGLVHIQNGRLVVNPPSRLPAEEERAPDFEGLDLDRYRYDHPVTGEKTLFLPYRLSKGCPSRCTFCTGRLVDRYTCKSVEKVARELEFLAGKYRNPHFMFADASVNGNPQRLSEICERLQRNLPAIRWYGYVKVNGLSQTLLERVKRAGCFSLFWGVESVSQPTVDLLGKNFRVNTMHELLEAAKALGIKNYIHLMYHTPHETKEEVIALIRFVERHIRSERVVFLPQRFLLEPPSLMFERPGDYGLNNLQKVEVGPLEREQFSYEEAGGVTREAVAARNHRHRRLLADHLEWIRYRNLLHDSSNPLVRRFPARFLVFTGKHAGHSKAVAILHCFLTKWLETRVRTLREQL